MESDNGFLAYIQEEEYSEEEVKFTFGDYDDIFKIEFTTKVIPKQNWNKEWESNFEPIDVVGKFLDRCGYRL